jgi:CRP/FNR family transcriptional regulator, cyclic AMP receptor protein
MATIWYLENVDVYGILCPHKMAEYATTHTFLHFGKDDIVYMESDAAKRIYLIAEGCVKIVSYSANGDERVKAILGKGELFGEMALFGVEERGECAIAQRGGTVLCPMNVETMLDLMRDYKQFSLGIHKLIGWKLRKIERRLEILLFKDAHTRLVEFLKDLAADHGVQRGTTMVINHFYTQQNIADLIGVARPTLNQVFNDLRASGVLDFKRGEIVLKNSKMFAA